MTFNCDKIGVFAAIGLLGCTPGGAGSEGEGGTESTTLGEEGAKGSAGATHGTDGGSGPGDSTDNPDTAGEDTGDVDPEILYTATRGGPIAINDSGTLLAVANKGTDEVTIFALPDALVLSRFSVGDEPVSVSWAADNTTIYVVNRGSANVMKVVDADGETPSVAGTVAVGSEPIMAALNPTGEELYVSSWVDGDLTIIDTQAMSVDSRIELGGAPYAVCVTNDGDDQTDDETIWVTDFYGRPNDAAKEATDAARHGRIFRISTGDHTVQESTLAPHADSGVTNFEATGFYPNQLYSCSINKAGADAPTLVYVTAVGASPASFNQATDFHQNVQGMVGVLDAETGVEVGERSVNLNALVDKLAAPKRFVAIPMDIAFAPNSDFGYVASPASNSLFRIDWSVNPPTGGAPSGVAFLPTGAIPTGIAILGKTAYAYNEVDRSVSVIDLAKQETVQMSLPSAPQPTDAGELAQLRGQKFFSTGLARWSTNGWVACLACHPNGLSDNVTWSFPTGPRQSTDLSGTFNAGATRQRILNWTGIFDEIHDFELNTRNVAGGTGAIVSSAELNMDGTVNAAARIDFVGPGGTADPTNGFNIGSARAVAASGAVPDDWDDIEAYIATLRAPRGAGVAEGDVEAGRVVFEEAGCHNCHGGPLWTLSERYYTPQLGGDARPLTLASQGVASIDVRPDQVSSADPQAVFVLQNDANGAPQRHSCVVRKVGTFDADGADGRGADEIRQNGPAAQGVDGFNVPSLLGVSLGAPYLHNGAAESLEQLLDPAGEFVTHLRAGNQVFSPSDDELADLVAFLRAIDDDTATFEIDPEFVFCPDGVEF